MAVRNSSCMSHNSTRNYGNFSKEHEQKIDEIRQLLLAKCDEEDSIESLIFVDTVQRLGVSHHFQEEIGMILRRHHEATYDHKYNTLHDAALSFRLLRQHGHDVQPGDVLKIFNGADGNIKEETRLDIRGLMELYEAAQLSFEGEHELDKAANISNQILNEKRLENMDDNCSMISFRLSHPYHKSLAGLTERHFLKVSVHMNEYEKPSRELTTMDLQLKQFVFRKELVQVTKWWNELGLATELKLVRNQPLKWYTWSMAALNNDVTFSTQRADLTKSIAFVYLIDDIFDLYGEPDELKSFVEAVNKWDYAAVDTLPDYMKMCYRALLDVTNEIALRIYKHHGYNPIESLKAQWGSLCDAFLVEANWFALGELPTAEEYLKNGIVSSGVHVVLIHLFFLLGLGGTRNGDVNLKDIPELVSSTATILRLWDDLGSAEDEHQDGKDGSYLEYYMKEHKGVTVAQAREHVANLIASAWKSLNKGCFNLNHGFALPFKNACLNLARMVPLMYEYDDNQSLPLLKDYVNFMLFDQTSLD